MHIVSQFEILLWFDNLVFWTCSQRFILTKRVGRTKSLEPVVSWPDIMSGCWSHNPLQLWPPLHRNASDYAATLNMMVFLWSSSFTQLWCSTHWASLTILGPQNTLLKCNRHAHLIWISRKRPESPSHSRNAELSVLTNRHYHPFIRFHPATRKSNYSKVCCRN